MGSIFSSFSNWFRRPEPGGVMLMPFGFWSMNLLSAISSMEGKPVPPSAEMKTIISLRPLRCSGRYAFFGYGGM